MGSTGGDAGFPVHRDDARRIHDAAHGAVWADDTFAPAEGPQPWDAEVEPIVEDAATADHDAPSDDVIWAVDGDDADAPREASESRGIWKRRRRKWYQRAR